MRFVEGDILQSGLIGELTSEVDEVVNFDFVMTNVLLDAALRHDVDKSRAAFTS